MVSEWEKFLLQAYAAARMAESCLLGLQGKDNIYECAYVQSSIVPGLDFFASKVRFLSFECLLTATSKLMTNNISFSRWHSAAA